MRATLWLWMTPGTMPTARTVRKTGISQSRDRWLPSSNNCMAPKISEEIITKFRNQAPEGLCGGDPQNGTCAVGFAAARRIVPHAPNAVATPIDRRPAVMGAVWLDVPGQDVGDGASGTTSAQSGARSTAFVEVVARGDSCNAHPLQLADSMLGRSSNRAVTGLVPGVCPRVPR